MNISAKNVNPLSYRGWDELVLSFKDYSLFHSSGWANVLFDSYGYQPTYFIFSGTEKILAVFPAMQVSSFITGTRGVSLPFSDHCDPLFTAGINNPEIFVPLFDYGKKKGWKYLEFRCLEKTFSRFCASKKYFSHSLKLEKNTDQILANFRNSTKRNIKKASKSGVTVHFKNSTASLKTYYNLHCLTRKRQGVPPQPYRFFQNIFNHFIANKKGDIVLAQTGDKTIAGAIFLQFGKKVMYKFGASDMKFQNLRANNLLFWEALKNYAEVGFESLDFGRTAVGHDGLRQFKNGWGTEEKEINYYKHDFKTDKFISENQNSEELQAIIFRALPVPVLTTIGKKFYKHMG